MPPLHGTLNAYLHGEASSVHITEDPDLRHGTPSSQPIEDPYHPDVAFALHLLDSCLRGNLDPENSGGALSDDDPHYDSTQNVIGKLLQT